MLLEGRVEGWIGPLAIARGDGWIAGVVVGYGRKKARAGGLVLLEIRRLGNRRSLSDGGVN